MTSLLGALVNTAVKVAVVPASDVVNGLPVSVKPAVAATSLSVLVMSMSAVRPLKLVSVEEALAVSV